MSSYIHKELLLFFQSFCAGIFLLLAYDLLTALRRALPHSAAAVALEDLMYWICTGFFVFAGIYRTNEGNLRSFLFLGGFLGAWIWERTLNPYVTEVFAGIIRIPVVFAKKTTKRLLFMVKRCKISLYLFARKRKSGEKGNRKGRKNAGCVLDSGGKGIRGFKGSRRIGSIKKGSCQKTNEE